MVPVPSIRGMLVPGTDPPPPPEAAMADATKAVVAIELSLSPGAGVGACGSPVKTGETSGAREVSVG